MDLLFKMHIFDMLDLLDLINLNILGSKPDGEDEDHDILQGENSLQISSLDVSGLNEANRLRGLVEDLIRYAVLYIKNIQL